MAAPKLIDNREAWLEARRHCLTATDVAAIVGLHPYRTAHEVYLEKTGQKAEQEPNKAMQTGTDLEPYIAAIYRQRFEVVTTQADFCTHPEHPELGCTPDYYIGNDTVLEIKWCGQHAAQNFGDEGTDDIPAHYLCQVQWQCFITGRAKWVLYVLGPWGFRKYEGKHNPEFTRRLSFQALKFWGEYILSECPPPLSGHAPDTAYVNSKAPLDDGSIAMASDAIEDEVADLGNELQQLEALELSIEGRKNRIKDFMGEASILKTASTGSFTWKKSKDRETTDWKAVALDLGAMLDEPRVEPTVQRHTITKEGSRVFRTPYSTGKA